MAASMSTYTAVIPPTSASLPGGAVLVGRGPDAFDSRHGGIGLRVTGEHERVARRGLGGAQDRRVDRADAGHRLQLRRYRDSSVLSSVLPSVLLR